MNFNVMSRETGLARLINNLSKPVVLPRKIVSLNTFKIHHLGFFVPIKNGLNIGLNIAFKRGISWTFLFETKISVWPLQWPLFRSLCLFLPIFSKILSKLSCLKMILISLFLKYQACGLRFFRKPQKDLKRSKKMNEYEKRKRAKTLYP